MLFTGEAVSLTYQYSRTTQRRSSTSIAASEATELKTPTRKECGQLCMDDFVTAFKKKMKNATEKQDFTDGEPFVIYECVSKKNFLDFLKKNPSVDQYGPVRFSGRKSTDGDDDKNDPDKILGTVSITRLTSDVHASTIGSVTNMILTSVFELTQDVGVFTSISSKPGMDCNIGPYIHRKLDGGLLPIEVKVGGDVFPAYENRPFPNVALEVAYKHEDHDQLIQELLELVSGWTSVQVAIGIKILNQRVDNVGDVLMTAYVYLRPAANAETVIFSDDKNLIPQFPPDQIVQFGTNVPHSAAGIFITFPLQALYFGVDPALVPQPIQNAIENNTLVEIELQGLKDMILSWI
jgi:hypothetical protein